MSTPATPLWEVFIRSRSGLAHRHVGSVHAADATLAMQAARDVYTRRGEGLSVWIVPSNAIVASDPADDVIGPHRTQETIGHHTQQLVTCGMTELVMHILESVKVNEDHRRPAGFVAVITSSAGRQ